MFNCKLSRNISLNPDGSSTIGGDCGSAEIASGGIQERVFVYNIDDVDNLQFENDMRFDNNLIIETIITQAAYFFIDCTDVSYNETQDGTKHQHNLNLTVSNTQPITEDTISDAANHRYLVAFRPKGAELYRVFGWKEGAGLSYTMDMNGDTNAYTINLSDNSEYALMSCYADNFDLANKVFSPIFKPLYEISYCETDKNGKKTGYCIASYVVKVNSAGQALDSNNMLSSYSGLKQDAYKYYGVPFAGGYNILDNYSDDASFDGLPVKIFDNSLCPIDAEGTITVTPTTIRLNSTTTTANVTITSSNPWKVANNSNLVTVSPSSGSGNGVSTIISNNTGGDTVVTYQNRTTYERVNVDVQIRLIKINNEFTYQNGTTQFELKPIVEGGSGDYLYSVDRTGLTITKQSDGTLLCIVNNPSSEFVTYTFTLTHRDDAQEKKYVAVNLQGSNTNAIWRMMAQYCEDI